MYEMGGMPPPPPKRKSNTVLWVVLSLIGAIFLCCGGVIFYSMSALKKVSGTVGCVMRFGLLYDAAKQYAAHHDGKLPDAKNWQASIAPYYAPGADQNPFGKALNMGDPRGDLGCPGNKGEPETGIAYNDKVAGKLFHALAANEILFFETPTNKQNNHEPYKPQKGYSPQSMMNIKRSWLAVMSNGQMLGGDMVDDKGRVVGHMGQNANFGGGFSQ